MKKTFAALAVSIALVSIGATVATAADMGGNGPGSLKDRGPGGVPVPAPMPYEDHYKFYMGAGLGWSFRSSGDIGLTAGGAGALAYGDVDDFKNRYGVSLFAGRYITPSVRLELGLDLRSKQNRGSRHDYTARLDSMHDFGAGAVAVTNTYTMQRDEIVNQRNHNAMLNVYYDMNRGGRFNPYVGAGIGVSYMHFSRAATETILACEGTPDPAIVPAPVGPQPCVAGIPAMPTGAASTSFNGGQSGFGLAAALMAGITYNITERTHLDMGYRLLYQGGKALITSSSLGYCASGCPFSGTSVMSVGSRIDHELRAGIRWDLW